VPDTYAESHINDTLTSPGLAADQAAQQKMDKYSKLLSTHINSVQLPWKQQAHGTVWPSNLFRRLVDASHAAITEDARETVFLFCSACPWTFNAVAFQTQCPPNESPLQPLTLSYRPNNNNNNNNALYCHNIDKRNLTKV